MTMAAFVCACGEDGGNDPVCAPTAGTRTAADTSEVKDSNNPLRVDTTWASTHSFTF